MPVFVAHALWGRLVTCGGLLIRLLCGAANPGCSRLSAGSLHLCATRFLSPVRVNALCPSRESDLRKTTQQNQRVGVIEPMHNLLSAYLSASASQRRKEAHS